MLDAFAVEDAELGDTGIAELDGLAIDDELDAAIVDATATVDADAADDAADDAAADSASTSASDIELEPVNAALALNGDSLTVPGVEER